MKQGGWSFKEFLFILSVIFIALILLVFTIKSTVASISQTNKKTKVESKQTETTSTDTYYNLEKRIKIAAQRYQNDNYQSTLESTEKWILKYKMLKKEGYIKEKMIDPKDKSIECNGYVIFEKNGAKINYTPYIKCGKNYITEGYEQSSVK